VKSRRIEVGIDEQTLVLAGIVNADLFGNARRFNLILDSYIPSSPAQLKVAATVPRRTPKPNCLEVFRLQSGGA